MIMGEQGNGPKVLVLYYSMYGHIHRLAEAIAAKLRA
jgi:flavorubredoxin